MKSSIGFVRARTIIWNVARSRIPRSITGLHWLRQFRETSLRTSLSSIRVSIFPTPERIGRRCSKSSRRQSAPASSQQPIPASRLKSPNTFADGRASISKNGRMRDPLRRCVRPGRYLFGQGDARNVTVDYGLCVFCGLCAEASANQAVRITQEFELAVADRGSLVLTAEYTLNADGTHRHWARSVTDSRMLKRTVESVGTESARKDPESFWGGLSPSAKWMRGHAMGVNWRSSRSTIRSMISNASAFTSSHLLVMPICSWSPAQ